MQKVFDVTALVEAMLEFNQTKPCERQYLQGFGGDTSNAVIAAALLARMAMGDDVFTASRCANAAAALAVQGYGAVGPLPRAAQVLRALDCTTDTVTTSARPGAGP